MTSPGHSAPYTPDREVRAMDRAFEYIRDGRITHHRIIASPTAADFYRYEYRLDGEKVTETIHRAIVAHEGRGYVRGDGFAGMFGPGAYTLGL